LSAVAVLGCSGPCVCSQNSWFSGVFAIVRTPRAVLGCPQNCPPASTLSGSGQFIFASSGSAPFTCPESDSPQSTRKCRSRVPLRSCESGVRIRTPLARALHFRFPQRCRLAYRRAWMRRRNWRLRRSKTSARGNARTFVVLVAVSSATGCANGREGLRRDRQSEGAALEEVCIRGEAIRGLNYFK